MPERIEREKQSTLPGYLVLTCVSIILIALIAALGFGNDGSEEASAMCLIAAAIVSGSLARAVMS